MTPSTTPVSRLPRVFILDPQMLVETRSTINAGDKRFGAAIRQLVADADKALKLRPMSVMEKEQVAPSGDKHDYLSLGRYWWPDPSKPDGLPYIQRDGQTNPEMDTIADKKYLGDVVNATGTLGLAYYFTGDERYAQKCTELLRVWYLNPETRMNPNATWSQMIRGRGEPSGTGIIDFVGMAQVVDYIGLLDGSTSWTASDQLGAQKWFGAFLDWLLISAAGQKEASAANNHGTWYDTQVVSLALFVGRAELANQILQDSLTKRIAAQIEPDGKQPEELRRTLALHYSVYNLSAFFRLAALGGRVGVDLWKYQTRDGRGIRAALDFLVPYLSHERTWPYPQIEPFAYGDAYPLLLAAGVKYHDSKYWAPGLKAANEDVSRSRLNLTLAPLITQ